MDERLETILREVDALPEDERRRITRVLEEEVREAKLRASRPADHWARFADRLSREAPLLGRSEEFLKEVREFRDNFDMSVKPTRR